MAILEEAIWSGIAKVALVAGIEESIANQIAHGMQKERDRFKAQWVSKSVESKRQPLDDVVDWLHN